MIALSMKLWVPIYTTHILIDSRLEEGTPKSNAKNTKYNSGSLLLTLSESNTIATNGIKTGSSKNIHLLKVKRKHSWIQGSNKIQQHLCWRSINHYCKCLKQKILQADVRNQIRHKKATLCGSVLKIFSKGTAHKTRRIPVSNLKALSG